MCYSHCAYHLKWIISFNSQNTLKNNYCYFPHLQMQNLIHRGLSNLSKVTRQVSKTPDLQWSTTVKLNIFKASSCINGSLFSIFPYHLRDKGLRYLLQMKIPGSQSRFTEFEFLEVELRRLHINRHPRWWAGTHF